jgi:3-oxoacyl-[acyl-carrier-protein] synthase-1
MGAQPERKPSVCIVGVGAKTPVGFTTVATAAAIRAGIPGFSEHSYLTNRGGEPIIVASVRNLTNGDASIDRFIPLAVEPAREALIPLAPFRRNIGRIALFLGLPPQRPGRLKNLEHRFVDTFQNAVGVGPVECIATGHSAGLMALEIALHRVAIGSLEFCLVGGVDSYLEVDTLAWIEENDQLHGDDNAYGFIPGEAAGFCLLCTEKTAERRHLNVLGRVTTVATCRETKLIKTDAVCVGKGLTEVFGKVFADLPAVTDKISHTICDMNGEPYRADEYGLTVARLSERFVDASAFLAPADCWGDVGAASGPLFVNLVVTLGKGGNGKAGYNLLWTSSESGERSAAILQREIGLKT